MVPRKCARYFRHAGVYGWDYFSGFYYIYIWLLAPEVMSRQNHGVAADYYAVGIIAYELMMGKVS